MLTILQEFNQNEYPKKTHVLCYHCCHKFSTQPISLPYKYENYKFFVKYVFCSWECMKTYNSDMNNSNSCYIYSLIQKLYFEIHKKIKYINFAPPKSVLKDFGGTMTINEFRQNNNDR